MLPDYNKIDVEKDDISVIKAKIKAMKLLVENGKMTNEEYSAEKDRVIKELEERGLVGYSFTW